MGLNATALNLMLDALGAAITHASLHTDAVGGGSGNEVSGGSPAYARQGVAWGAASGGDLDLTGTEVFDIPSGTTVRRVGFFGHLTNATPYYGDADITDEAYGGQGTYTLTDADVTLT
jgi:hypothetical protein